MTKARILQSMRNAEQARKRYAALSRAEIDAIFEQAGLPELAERHDRNFLEKTLGQYFRGAE